MIVFNKLPNEYQEVEYIQTSGGQYINTTITGASKWLITAEYTNQSSSTQILIGTSIQAKNWFGQSSNVYSCGVDTTISSATKADIELDFGTNLTAKVNNETVTRTDGTFNTSNNFKLFGFTLSYSKAKIYKIKCIQNNQIVLNMIPCYRKSDNEIGMYDLATNTFYENEGSGSFTKGDNVSNEATSIIFSKIPLEYQEVEYIESSGRQYINTGVLGKGSIGYDMEVKIKSYGSENGVLATSTSSAGPHYVLQAHNGALRLYLSGATTPVSNVVIYQTDTTNFHIVTYNVQNDFKAYYDGVYQKTSSIQDTPNIPYPFTIFARNIGGVVQKYSYCIIKYLKIYDAGVLIRNFIPCYRKSDNEIGMYDTVGKTFYTNQGTGVFAKGSDVLPKEVKQIEDINGNIWWKKEGGGLPSSYIPVEYIENTGQSYIDTGFTLNQNSKVELTVYSTDFTQGHLFGSRESATSKNFTISDGHLDFGTYTTNRITFNTHADNLKTKLTIDKNTFRVDNESYNDTYQLASVSDFTCIDTAYIFYVSGNPYGNYRVWGKLYGCRIWDNGTLVRELVPCYRKTDAEPGMYDLVNDVFYTNAGTGTFGTGPEILPSEYTRVSYIGSSGSQYIDTNFIPNQDTKLEIHLTTKTISGDVNRSIFGSRTSATSNHYGMTIGGNNCWWIGYGATNGNTAQAVSSNTEYTIVKNKNVTTINGTQMTPATAQTFTCPSNLYLFGMDQNGIAFKSSIKLHSCRIFNDGVLTRCLIPCYKNSDNTIGLYDMVNDILYTNAGTGTFELPE